MATSLRRCLGPARCQCRNAGQSKCASQSLCRAEVCIRKCSGAQSEDCACAGKANGGKVYGQWPGLEDLDQSQDLRITTDYRTVLSEVLIRRLGNAKLGTVFPGISEYAPLGLTGSASEDTTPDFTSALNQVYLPVVTR